MGATLGESLSRVLAETIIKAAGVTVPHKAEHTRNAIDGWMDEAEAKFAPLVRSMLGEAADLESTPEGMQAFLSAAGEPQNQTDFILQVIGVIGWAIAGVGILGAIQAQEMANELWALKLSKPLSPPDLADMVERNIVGEQFGRDEAAKSGVSPQDFDLMVKDTGEPYGIEQGLNLLRRGLISEERFSQVLYYSRVRNEFLPDVLDLAHDTMSAGDAIEGALKGVLDHGTAQALFAEAGGLSDQFPALLDIAGNAIGVESALNLLNHSFISEADARRVIHHSRINPIFEDMALLQRHRFLSAFQIVNAVKGGAATAAQAISWLEAEGYPADQVTAVVGAAAAGKAQTHKDVTEAQIATMYEAGAITHADAAARLVALGYEAKETDFILAVYAERRHLAMIQAAIGQVRKVYLARRVDDATVTNQLTALGVDPGAIATYLTVWKIEQASELRELTAAQVGSLYKKGAFDDAGARDRWELMGYDATDAALLLFNYGGPPPAGSPAALAAGAGPAPAAP